MREQDSPPGWSRWLTVAILVGCLTAAGYQATDVLADGDEQAKSSEGGVALKGNWVSFRNGNSQQGVATSSLPDKLEVLWKVSAADGWVASPTIVDGKVYVGSLSGDFYRFDLKTGEEEWKYRSIDSDDPDEFAPGFKAAARVTKSGVYVGDEDGVLHALDRATGKRLWKFTTDAEIAGCPAVVGDRIVFGSHDSFLYCLNEKDGSVAWSFQTDDRVNCSPAIAGDYTFVAGCDEHLRVINIKTGKQERDIPLQSYLIASPAIWDNMLYVGTYASEVVAVDWTKGTFAWRFRDGNREFPYHASAAVTNDYVVVGGQDKTLHCIQRKDGQEKWNFKTRAQINSSAVIVGDRVFFGSNDGNLYGVGMGDGKEVYRLNMGGDISASPAVGGNCLVLGAEGADGVLYCLGAKSD